MARSLTHKYLIGVKLIGNGNRSSFLEYGKNYYCKSFIEQDSGMGLQVTRTALKSWHLAARDIMMFSVLFQSYRQSEG